MSNYPERICFENAVGCQKKYFPKKFWQMTCENPACKLQRKRRMARQWQERNKEKLRIYQAEYRAL